MPGIYLAALLTATLAAIGFGLLVARLRQPADQRCLWAAALVTLPLQPLVFYYLRVPLDHWLASRLDVSSPLYQALLSLYAPLTEEPAKLVPLLIPAIRRDLRPENFARYSLAIGLGFALGEMQFVAGRVAHHPTLSQLPFYQFGGFFGERLMTCVMHSAFVAISLSRWRRRFVLGIAGAVFLHWLGNFPIMLMTWNVGGFGHQAWTALVQVWLILFFLGSLTLLSRFAFGRLDPVRLFYGPRRCPECHRDYPPPLVAVNLLRIRYERCPHCRHWHWTRSSPAATAAENPPPSP